jgi:very-short-patch-repair endonuclease
MTMPEVSTEHAESPALIRERAASLVEYLLAVRALIEKPVRTVPAADAFWQADLPRHPACELGPRQPGGSWLAVGRPGPPDPPVIAPPLVPYLVWDLSWTTPPRLTDGAPERVTPVFSEWYERSWTPWSRETVAAEATRRLHDRLYDLRYRLDIDSARLELVWGHAVLSAVVGGATVEYPLIATPVAIEYDADAATVRVVPQGPARLQADALSEMDDRRLADLLDLGGVAGQVEVDPWDAAERREFAGRAIRRMGLDAVLVDETGLPEGEEPARHGRARVRDTGVLFVRPRQRMVRRFLADMRDRLTEDGVGALANILAAEPSRLRMPDDEPEAWARTGDRLLMPLPTNDAQESIARRLSAHRSIAVQGPPGTGKTHTIRNLISHLVAHGKRVLVLAQKEDPLRVLRDGLPEEIQPLCLAVLGRSADQLVQLQIAARELADRAATLDRGVEAARVARLTAAVEAAEADLTDAQAELRAVAERESVTYPLDGFDASPGEVGEWLRRHAGTDALIPDPIPPGTPLPLNPAELGELLELGRRLPVEDRVAALGTLPADGSLPAGETRAGNRAALRDAGKVVEALRDRGVAVEGVRRLGETELEELARGLRLEADALARREGEWTDRLGNLVRDPSWQALWEDHVRACQELLHELARRTAFLAGHEVTIDGEHTAEPRRLLTQLAEIRGRLAAGKRVNRLTQGDLVRIMADSTVDGEPLRTVSDVDLVTATVERRQLRHRLTQRWAEWAGRLSMPLPGGAGPAVAGIAPVPAEPGTGIAEPEMWAGRLLTEAVDALDWERRRWPALHATLAQVFPGIERSVGARRLGELAGAVEACDNVLVEDRLAAQERTLGDWLTRSAADAAASPALRDLARAWHASDLTAWDAALAEIRRLWTIREGAVRFAALHARLAPVAPRWAAALEIGEGVPVDPAAVAAAWRWRQAQTWFDETVGATDTAAQGRRVERCREQIRRLTRELVVTQAWLEVALTLDDRRKAALADWTAALRKIGKGTGKTAAHWQAVAQRAMGEAVTAVPVWVMSIDRALEQFRGGEPLFDVVIVDEASQADIFALPVLSLARRAVVVGDDQQIGPQLVGVPADRVNALIATHLADVPSGPHFDTESSLYDHAVRRSPERILLTEHFRSVPAIISFSSDTYYDRKIQPLRADRPLGIGAAVTAVHVADGKRETLPEYGAVNVAEAEAVVARIREIVVDPAYAGRTLGVMSLLSGSGQAPYLQHRLREEIGAAELERRELRVGDPYTFQGDERDVVLISMVVSGADGDFGAFTKRDFHRRINVAASRARDQMWLFHSVRLPELHADDARALLLAHALRPAPERSVEDPEERCENDFERAVLRRLRERGLAPVTQFRLGSYRIDFVLAAPDGRRLAIECDGDRYAGADAFAADLRRQAVLERVGNCVFVRLRASVFQRDPERAMAPVWERAEELDIS